MLQLTSGLIHATSWSKIDAQTRKPVLLSEVQRRQKYIDMMTGENEWLKPLVIACLADDPHSRPIAVDLSERIKMLKESYASHNMDPKDKIHVQGLSIRLIMWARTFVKLKSISFIIICEKAEILIVHIP